MPTACLNSLLVCCNRRRTHRRRRPYSSSSPGLLVVVVVRLEAARHEMAQHDLSTPWRRSVAEASRHGMQATSRTSGTTNARTLRRTSCRRPREVAGRRRRRRWVGDGCARREAPRTRERDAWCARWFASVPASLRARSCRQRFPGLLRGVFDRVTGRAATSRRADGFVFRAIVERRVRWNGLSSQEQRQPLGGPDDGQEANVDITVSGARVESDDLNSDLRDRTLQAIEKSNSSRHGGRRERDFRRECA